MVCFDGLKAKLITFNDNILEELLINYPECLIIDNNIRYIDFIKLFDNQINFNYIKDQLNLKTGDFVKVETDKYNLEQVFEYFYLDSDMYFNVITIDYDDLICDRNAFVIWDRYFEDIGDIPEYYSDIKINEYPVYIVYDNFLFHQLI